jgi:hypothetical protein
LTTGGGGWGIVGLMSRSLAALVLAGLALAGVALTVGAQGREAALDRAAPAIVGGPWINTEPLAPAALRGRVVFVEFWTYG